MELMEQARTIFECTHGQQHPDVANILYGLACIECLTGRVSEALQHMEQAAAAGLTVAHLEHVSTNHDPDAIRDDARFQALFPQ